MGKSNNVSTVLYNTVRQLAPPTSTNEVFRNKYDYGCLFDDECIRMDAEKVERFVKNARTFIAVRFNLPEHTYFMNNQIFI